MLFNSIPFLVFITLFFVLYWCVFNKSVMVQNRLLLFSSYLFYAFFDPRFVVLLFLSGLVVYVLSKLMNGTDNESKKRLYLYLGLAATLGTLIYFKYCNFFISSLNDISSLFGSSLNLKLLHLLLPVGISFYTFRLVSYLLDVDKNKITPTKSLDVFLCYVSFFPTLVVGPIDKGNTLIPQLEKAREFDYSKTVDGLRQILWGLFKKAVIADNCATLANEVFNNYTGYNGSALLVAVFFYTIQIYADFSGYSDMAIGVARIIGFNITRNFDFPFFALNIAEFWRKWHMSLTNWLTEYVFTPLSILFRNLDRIGLIFAILINFTIVGFWHGASWNYVLFGYLHGCLYIPLILKGKLNKRKSIAKDAMFPTVKESLNVLLTFTLVMLLFVIFRTRNIPEALHYYQRLFSGSLFSMPGLPGKVNLIVICVFSFVLITVEWFQRNKQHGLQFDAPLEPGKNKPVFQKAKRWSVYFLLVLSILCFMGRGQDFIYLQF